MESTQSTTVSISPIKVDPVGILNGKYTLTRKLGSGGTAKVYKAFLLEKGSGVPFAIKVMDPMKQGMKTFRNEVDLLMKINHANVISILDKGEGNLYKPNGKKKYVTYIVLEFLDNGELFDYLYFLGKGFGERLGRMLFLQILEGLEAIHKAGVYHRDLKTENIMVGPDFLLKIADFGYSTKSKEGLLTTICGSKYYFPPELSLRKAYSGEKNDVFCLGVILFILITGGMPYGDKHATNKDKFYSLIIQNNYEAFWKLYGDTLKSVSDEFKTLYVYFIAFDPESRPTLAEIKAHPWVQQGYDDWNDNDMVRALKEELVKRKNVVDYKRWKKRQEKILLKQKKLNMQSENGVYRGDTIDDEEELKSIKAYDYNENPFIIPFTEECSPKDIFSFLNKYFENEGAEFKPHDEKCILEVQLEDDLKIKAEVLSYETNKYLIEFSRLEGDKLSFKLSFDKIVEFIDKLTEDAGDEDEN